MKIWELIQETWNSRHAGDFALPRTIGHFSSWEKMDAARTADIKRHAGKKYHTTYFDYDCREIEVDPEL